MDVGTNRGRNFIFLTMNDFTKDGGGSVRIYGIVNALAENGCEVALVSNTLYPDKFHPAVRHVDIKRTISKKDKKIIQGLVSWFPGWVAALIYRKLLRRLSECMEGVDTVYSFEYLDNTLAYLLKSQGYISHYVNDTHGMAVLEFDAQFKAAANPIRKLKFMLKRVSAKRLDRKVFGGAQGVIYGSREMQQYFESQMIRGSIKPEAIVIPFVFGGDTSNHPDPDRKNRLQTEHNISADDFVFMFAGSYKITSGVDNLIDAFVAIRVDHRNAKLILIGNTGPLWASCRELARKSQLGDSVVFVDRIDYKELTAYQQLADVIVCPDRANAFSDYIVHVKYFDALWSAKPVINGRFASLELINQGDRLSVSFDPADPSDLLRAMRHTLNNYSQLAEKYRLNRDHVMQNFTYRSFVSAFVEWDKKRIGRWE